MFIMPTDSIASDITTSIYVGVMEFNRACAKSGWKGNVSVFFVLFVVFLTDRYIIWAKRRSSQTLRNFFPSIMTLFHLITTTPTSLDGSWIAFSPHRLQLRRQLWCSGKLGSHIFEMFFSANTYDNAGQGAGLMRLFPCQMNTRCRSLRRHHLVVTVVVAIRLDLAFVWFFSFGIECW